MAYKGSTTFLPVFLAQGLGDTLGLTPLFVGAAGASFVLAAGIFGQYAGGVLADRIGPEFFYFLANLFAGVTSLVMAFSRGPVLLVIAMLQSIFAFSVLPVKNILISRRLSHDDKAVHSVSSILWFSG